jgi:hypothetical protein
MSSTLLATSPLIGSGSGGGGRDVEVGDKALVRWPAGGSAPPPPAPAGTNWVAVEYRSDAQEDRIGAVLYQLFPHPLADPSQAKALKSAQPTELGQGMLVKRDGPYPSPTSQARSKGLFPVRITQGVPAEIASGFDLYVLERDIGGGV